MICEKCFHNFVCFDKILQPLVCSCFKDKRKVVLLPCNVGDVFYGLNETSYDAYEVLGFKYGKRRGEEENVLIVLTIYETEFVWGEEAFLTIEEAKKALKEIVK